MNRNQQILAAILAAQIILSVIVLWPRTVTTGGAEPLFPDLNTEDVVSMTVTDADGQEFVLREVSGGWGLPDADEYPAKTDRVTSALDKIKGLTTGRLVTRTEASHKRLQVAVDDFLRRIDLKATDGSSYTLLLGSSPSYGTSHVRVEGHAETYLASDLSPWDFGTSAVSWVDTSYLSIEHDLLTSVTLENANGRFDFAKDEDGNWILDGLARDEELSTDNVNSTLNGASRIVLTKPLGKEVLPDYGLDNPTAVITLKTADHTVTLTVGSQDPDDKSYVVHASTSPYYVRVAEYNIQSLVEASRDSFLVPEATPTPAA
jgi:hypothetical protein